MIGRLTRRAWPGYLSIRGSVASCGVSPTRGGGGGGARGRRAVVRGWDEGVVGPFWAGDDSRPIPSPRRRPPAQELAPWLSGGGGGEGGGGGLLIC